MKTLTALFTAAALTVTAGFAQADNDDVSDAQASQLVQEGKIKPTSFIESEVMKLHPGASIKTMDLEKRFKGYEYEVDIRDAQGNEWDLEFDATTGKVLSNKQDND